MYRCDNCQIVVSAGKPGFRVVVATRSVRHPRRTYRAKPRHKKDILDRGGLGTQIVREITCCAECARAVSAQGAETAATRGRVPSAGSPDRFHRG